MTATKPKLTVENADDSDPFITVENHMDYEMKNNEKKPQEDKQSFGKQVLSRMNELPLPAKALAWLVFAPNGFNVAVLFLITKYVTPIIRQASFMTSPMFLLGLKVTGVFGIACLVKRFFIKD